MKLPHSVKIKIKTHVCTCKPNEFRRESLSPVTFAQRFARFCEMTREPRQCAPYAITNHCHFRLNMSSELSVPRRVYATRVHDITFPSLIPGDQFRETHSNIPRAKTSDVDLSSCSRLTLPNLTRLVNLKISFRISYVQRHLTSFPLTVHVQ